jgi:DNA-nicking Smr family endonuclease
MTIDDGAENDDLAAFRAAMADVTPLRTPERLHHRRPPPPPVARQTQLDEAAILRDMLDAPDPDSHECGDTLSYRGDGLQDAAWRKLRRGQYHLQAELDLHGMNRDMAQRAIAQFLLRCEALDHRCVRIIHGKGNGSPNSGPVIKRLVDGWLRRRQQVIAFCSARPHDGGTGAVYVLLRAAR